MKSIDLTSFRSDLTKSSLNCDSHKDSGKRKDVTVNNFNSTLSTLLDKHAPKSKRTVVEHTPNPWINDQIIQAKRERRRRENDWRKSKLTVHLDIYKEHCQNVKNLIEKEKSEYYRNIINESKGNQKKLFNIVNSLLNNKKPNNLPSSDSNATLAESFSTFFQDKIQTIRSDLSKLKETTALLSCPPTIDLIKSCGTFISEFNTASQKEIENIIRTSSKATCSLDPIPTKLLIECLPELLPAITNIVNVSFTSGQFPPQIKTALVKPLLKKANLNSDVFSNYRPVSNLPFISKVIERTISTRLLSHMNENHLMDEMQSAYKVGHSTETALLRVQNDILTAVDKGKGIFAVFLDLSAAFDTIDHEVLLNFLSKKIGIKGKALSLLQSYFLNRSQRISIRDALSATANLLQGVPQGSVLGPLAFCIYILPLGAILRYHKIAYHIYADDTQLYLSFDLKDHTSSLQTLLQCISNVRTWMLDSNLKINDSKTEFLIITSSHQRHSINDINIEIGDSKVAPSLCAKSLGVTFDNCMTMDNHVINCCRSIHFHIRNIGKIRHLLSQDTAAQLVHSVITSRLDYCNSLLYGLPDTLTGRLQRMQNIAARIVSRTSKSAHITPVLKILHWLPVKQRIKFKVLLLTHKIIHSNAPDYLRSLIIHHMPSRLLRSSNHFLLEVPKTRLKTYGDRSFSYAAPTEWNKLPIDLRTCSNLHTFKSELKTYLFKEYFN